MKNNDDIAILQKKQNEESYFSTGNEEKTTETQRISTGNRSCRADSPDSYGKNRRKHDQFIKNPKKNKEMIDFQWKTVKRT